MSPTVVPMPVPASVASVSKSVEARLEAHFDTEERRWGGLDPSVGELVGHLREFVLRGGKRLRPVFCYWGHVAAGGVPDAPEVHDAGAAFEMLQAFALIHDDVMDGSAVRRGARTSHLAYEDRHRTADWRGEARRFGEGVAILLGDLAHVYADQLMPRRQPEVQQAWDELRTELNVGQYLDLAGTARGGVGHEAARRIARYKSGKYTIERPLHVGAALVGRYRELAPVLSAYGDPLGEAFQLRDDLLGAFGDEAATGKPVGDDLREGKPTALLALAIDAASPGQAESLARVGSRELDDDGVAAVQSVLTETGAVAEIERSIEALTGQATDSLAGSGLPGHATEALTELARYVARRTS